MKDPAAAPPARVVVVAMGNEYRRDDGAGQAIAARVARALDGVDQLGPVADPLDLLGLWDDADLAVVIDAVQSGAEPGSVALIDLDSDRSTEEAGQAVGASSTHGIGLAGVLRLARALGSAPRRVVVVGIEGDDFGEGTGLSPAVDRAISRAAGHVVALIKEVR